MDSPNQELEKFKIRLNLAFVKLQELDYVNSIIKIAEIMEAERSGVNKAFQGNPKHLTTKFLRRFLTAFPFFNSEWLLDGKGEMINPALLPVSINTKEIPLVVPSLMFAGWANIDQSIPAAIEKKSIQYYVTFPGSREGDIAVRVEDDTNYPLIPAGTLMHLRQIPLCEVAIDPNQFYFIQVSNDFILGRIKKESIKSDNTSLFRVQFMNTRYEDQYFPSNAIRRAWKTINYLVIIP